MRGIRRFWRRKNSASASANGRASDDRGSVSLQGPAWPRCVRRDSSSGGLLRRLCKAVPSRLSTVASRLGTVVLLLVIVFSTSPVQAACHHYKLWRFPFPQKCFTALAPLPKLTLHLRPDPPERTVPKQERIEIALPPLEFVPCQEGDDYLQGIAKLRALMDAR